MYIIYQTTNLTTGQIYIGQHKVKNDDLDPKYLGSGIILKNAIQKYGIENFCRDILDECDSLEDANILETAYIDIYESNNPEIGYNIALGGKNYGSAIRWIKENDPKKWKQLQKKFIANGKRSPSQFKKGHQLSTESIEKMKKHLPKKRKPLSEETKKKIGDANRGRTSWAKGKKLGPLSNEVKQKISKAHSGRKLSEEHKKKISDGMKKYRIKYGN